MGFEVFVVLFLFVVGLGACWCTSCCSKLLFRDDDNDEEFDRTTGQRSKIRHGECDFDLCWHTHNTPDSDT